MEARILRVREPEPRSLYATPYANTVANPKFREIVVLDRRCNCPDLAGMTEPVIIPPPLAAAGLMTLFLPKLSIEGIQIHAEDIEILMEDDYAGRRIVSDCEAIARLQNVNIEVEIIGQHYVSRIIAIQEINENELEIVENLAEISIE